MATAFADGESTAADESDCQSAAATSGQMSGQASVRSVASHATGDLQRSGAIMRTATALLSVQGVTWATTLVGIVIVPRFLGPGRLGLLAATSTLAGMVALVAAFGTTNQIVKSVARDRAGAATIVVHAIIVRVAVWAFATLAIVVGLVVFGSQDDLFIVGLILASTGVALVSGALVAGLQGNQSIGLVSISAAAIGVVAQAITILILLGGAGLVELSALGLMVSAATASVVAGAFWAKLRGPIHLSRRTAVAVVGGGIGFLAWDLALQIYGAVDYLLLAALTDATTVGNYAFAYRLAGVPIFAATIVTASIYPTLAAWASRDDDWFKTVATTGVRVVLIATVPMSVGLAILAPEITALIGGVGAYHQSAILLRILSFHIPLAACDTVLGVAMFARDRQRYMATIGWIAAVANPAVNLAAIPLTGALWSNGAIGAALVTVATEIFMGLLIWMKLKEHLDRRALALTALRIAVAVLPMGFAAKLVAPSYGVPLAVLAGAAVYAIAAGAVGLLKLADLRNIRGAMRARPGGNSPSDAGVPDASASQTMPQQKFDGRGRP